MNLTTEIDLPEIKEAEKLWKEENFQSSAQKYQEAASYVMKRMKNEPLAKKFIMQSEMAGLLVPGQFSLPGVDRLLLAIDDYINNTPDDRLEERFRPYKEYFAIIRAYFNEDRNRLEQSSMVLKDKLHEHRLADYETLNLFLIEMALARQDMKEKKGSTHLLKHLSIELMRISDAGNSLPEELNRLLKEFAIQMNGEQGYDEKKKIVEEILKKLVVVSPGFMMMSFMKTVTNLSSDIGQAQMERFIRRHNKVLRAWNYVFIAINVMLVILCILAVNRVYSVYAGVILGLLAMLLRNKFIDRFLGTRRWFLVVQVILSAMLVLLLVFMSTNKQEEEKKENTYRSFFHKNPDICLYTHP